MAMRKVYNVDLNWLLSINMQAETNEEYLIGEIVTELTVLNEIDLLEVLDFIKFKRDRRNR
jgi:hypothetical protein